MSRSGRAVLVALTGALCALLSFTPVAAATPAGPEQAPAQTAPAPLDPSPAGSNDFSCRPTAAHPRPVVLVHGLLANQGDNWAYMAPIIKAQGYCVFSLTYGRNPLAPPPLSQIGGLTTMEQSAGELKAFVERVRSATGSATVDIVGHSEGSLMPDYYVRFLGGDRVVAHYVGMTPLWDGTRLLGLNQIDQVGRQLHLDPAYGPLIAQFCASCREFLHGSAFLTKLNRGGAASPAVTYTTIMTRNDELVIPYTSGRLTGAHVTNVVLQDLCPNDQAEHVGEAFDPVTTQVVLNALDTAHAQPVHCTGPPR